MKEEEFTGLTQEEVSKKKSLGLSNDVIDTYTPSNIKILFRNIFNLINIILIPLMIVLWIFELRTEVLAFSTFAIINTIVSILDELRAKKQLDKLKSEFQQTATIIREGKKETLPLSDIVEGDIIFAKEGEGIVADGELLNAYYLQLDESALTGESNYVQREKSEQVRSGSYVVTGNCIYRADKIGKNNYLNKLGAEALKYSEKKSSIQADGDKLIFMLIVSCIGLAVANFLLADPSFSAEAKVLSLTTIVVLIIPQTLIFLFTLTFTISITKLFQKGVLIQKGGSIEELSKIEAICFDKTGTITTNNMFLKDIKYWNTTKEEFGSLYNSIQDKIVSVNKTQSILNKFFSDCPTLEVSEFDQVPFTSKNKFSLVKGVVNKKEFTLKFGAISVLEESIDKSIFKEISNFIAECEESGDRVLVGLQFENDKSISKKVIVLRIEEELNQGIKDIFNRLKEQGIAIKIISGDSLLSVQKILKKLQIEDAKAVDLSTVSEDDLDKVILENNIFTRAKPEDKLRIIKTLKSNGIKIAMVGDGINDVLALKGADVAIAMEHGSKIAREVSDIVLLNNDYSKIPDIFFEGENIVYNLKLSTKLFLIKSFFTMFIALFFTLQRGLIPINPPSVLIFSFLGTSAPSYVIVFTRQLVKNKTAFFTDVIKGTLPDAIVFAVFFVMFYFFTKDSYNYTQVNSGLIILILSLSIIYSLILVWESKKLQNIALSIFLYVILLVVGIYQTLLPLSNYTSDAPRLLAALAGVLVGSVLIFTLLSKTIKKYSLKWVLLKLLVSVIWIPLIWVFPFQSYYQVTNLPNPFFGLIGIFSLFGFIIMIIISKLFHSKN